MGQRRLSFDRWRRNLAECRSEREPRDWPHRCSSRKPGNRLTSQRGDIFGKTAASAVLFKTTDGGKTWKIVLHAPAAARRADRLWRRRASIRRIRRRFTRRSMRGNARRGVLLPARTRPAARMSAEFSRARTAAATWKKLGGGLAGPNRPDRFGRVSASNPKVVMAVVQSYEGGSGDIGDLRSKSGGVFRSEDGGEKWTRVSAIDPRPFYFSQIRIDPANDQRVYLLQFALLVSDDGGKNFREDLSEKTSSRLPRVRDSTWHRAGAETAETGGQKQTAETAGLSAGAYSEPMAAFIKVLPAEKTGII